MAKKNDNKLIGLYNLCGLNVRIYWSRGMGGEFNFNPGPDQTPEIIIGFDEPAFSRVLSVLIHELLEFSLTEAGLRWRRCDDWSDSHDGYTFIMSHPQFSDMCGRVGNLMADCLPAVSVAWNKYKRTQKPKSKGR